MVDQSIDQKGLRIGKPSLTKLWKDSSQQGPTESLRSSQKQGMLFALSHCDSQ